MKKNFNKICYLSIICTFFMALTSFCINNSAIVFGKGEEKAVFDEVKTIQKKVQTPSNLLGETPKIKLEPVPLKKKFLPVVTIELKQEDDRKITKFEKNGYIIENNPYTVEKTDSWKDIEIYVYEVVDKLDTIDPATAYAVMKVESSFQSDAFSVADCVGLMQLDPYYQVDRMMAQDATNLFDPHDNIRVGCDYFNTLMREYGLELAVKVYGWGADNADKECYQDSMQVYIDKVYRYKQEWDTHYKKNYEVYKKGK